MTAPAFFLATLGLSALSFGKGESCHPHFCRLGHLLPSFLEILPTTFTIQALPPSFLYVQPPATFANPTPMPLILVGPATHHLCKPHLRFLSDHSVHMPPPWNCYPRPALHAQSLPAQLPASRLGLLGSHLPMWG